MTREEAIMWIKTLQEDAIFEVNKALLMAIESLSADTISREDTVTLNSPISIQADRPTMTEEVRDALMRLTMCAREECGMCKYKHNCSFDKQVEMATENMNTIANAFKSADRPHGEWIRKGNTLKCPFCGAYGEDIKDDYVFNFCPNCGALMGGDGK